MFPQLITNSFLIETTIEERSLWLWVTNEDEFEHREKLILGVFLETSDSRNSEATKKINNFLPETSSTSVLL